MNRPCVTCGAGDLCVLPTYRRHWHLCRACGTAVPVERERLPLEWLPFDDLKRRPVSDAQAMYDYFVEDVHIAISKAEGEEFVARYLEPNGIDPDGLEVLDLSGGNGFFLEALRRRGARATLTEFNRRTVEYARDTHAFEAVLQYDMNVDRLSDLVDRRYDLILCRANLMFCEDLPAFVCELSACLGDGGRVVVNHSVQPTLGVLVRVQLDTFSYHVLRQPETVADAFESAGFETLFRHDETDPTLYVYDHDLLPHWFWLHYFYEVSGARILRAHREFAFPARDRRRSTMIFRLAAS